MVFFHEWFDIAHLTGAEIWNFLPTNLGILLTHVGFREVDLAFGWKDRIKAFAVLIVEWPDGIPLTLQGGQTTGLQGGQDRLLTRRFLDVLRQHRGGTSSRPTRIRLGQVLTRSAS